MTGAPTSAATSQRQLEAVANNATLALFLMDEHQQCTYMNPAAERLTGYTLAEVRGRALHDVVHHTRPDGRPFPIEECPIDRALPQSLQEQGEEVFVHRDGHFYPVAFTASPVRDGDRTIGTVIEVRPIAEDRRQQAERERMLAERDRLLADLRLERERLHQIFVHAPAMISVTRGPEHLFELVNPAYQATAGDRALLGRPLRQALPELEGQGFFEMRDTIYATGRTVVQNEARVLADLDGDGVAEEHFLNFVTQPLRGAGGEVDGILTFAVDVTEQVRARRVVEEQATELESQAEALQRQAEQLEETQIELELSNRELTARAVEAEQASAAARAAAARLEVLAEAGVVLGSSLDVRATLDALAHLVVPRLADWCFIEMPTADGRIEPVAVHHTDPAGVALARETLRRYPIDPQAPYGTGRVMRTGEPELMAEISEEMLAAVAQDAEHLRLLRSVGLRASLTVPLTVRGTTIGTLSLVMAASGRRLDEADVVLAQELAHRAALAVEHARLYDAELSARRTAERAADRSHQLQAVAAALNEAERTARAEAEAANRAKTEFLSAMSHELRTPLNAIAGYVDLLDLGIHGPLSDAQRNALARIKHAQNVLLGLISDILYFARIEAGRIEVVREPVALAPLLADLETIVEPQVQSKGLAYLCGTCDADVSVLGDPERIRQILMNLLSNAVKFTGAGGRIEVDIARDGDRVAIRVADTGRGIAPERLASVFEPFVQIDRQGSEESQQGVGLGLAISRELAAAMDGTLTAESTPGVGSTFTLALPTVPSPSREPQGEPG